MITIEIFEAVSFYKRLTEEVKQGSLNPFEISTEDLKELVGENIYHNGGLKYIDKYRHKRKIIV